MGNKGCHVTKNYSHIKVICDRIRIRETDNVDQISECTFFADKSWTTLSEKKPILSQVISSFNNF